MKSYVITIILFVACFANVEAQKKHSVIMTGLDVVPDVHTPASGGGEAWVESDTLYVRLEFENLQAPYYTSNIHYGEEGENGNPIYKLTPSLSEDHLSGTFDPENNKFALSDAMKEAFENGNLYITIASEQHQRGELRGQIDGF